MKKAGMLAFSVSTLALAGNAAAQEATTAAGEEQSQQSSQGLQEIIVTAQKRTESLNDVPLSITVASGEQLRNQGVSDVADLVKIVPGFNYTESAYATPVYTLRGVGFYDTSLAAKPTVSVYQDQVPIPFSIMTRGATLDLERIEVLKGPQGTLFGSNATGGAINYIAAKPTDYFEGGMNASVQNFGEVTVGGHVSGPLGDTIKARIAAQTVQGGAWQRSYTRDDELGDQRFTNARMLVDFEPSDSLRFEMNVNGFIDKSDGQAAQLTGVVPLGNPARLGDLATYPIAPENNRDADWTEEQQPKRDNWFYQASLRGDLDLSNAVTLTSITSWSEYSHDTDIDPDGVSLRGYFYNTTGKITALSQELRIQGETGNLTWILGGNFAREKTYQQDDAGPYDQSTSAYNFVDAGIGGPFFVYSQYARQKFVNKAVFANLDYDIGDMITLHGGIRYTDTDIDFTGCTADRGDALGQGIENLLNFIRSGAGLDPVTIAPDACVTIDSATLTAVEVTDTLDEDNVSWRAGIDFKPSADTLVYASVSRGFKSGSFPLLSASDAKQFSPVTQESVTAYEIGTKLTVLDRMAQINAAVFYYDYSDKQFKGRVVANPDIFGPLEALVNVPRSEVKGAEVQLDLAPTDGLRISIGATYLDTKIKGSFVNYDSYGNQVEFAGSSFPYTPKYQVVMDGQYEWALSDNVSPYIGANLSFQSDSKAVLGDARVTPSADLSSRGGLLIDDYILIDLRAGMTIAEKYKIGAFVRNLTNEYYWTNATRITDTTVRYTGRPRTFGISASVSF
ncbi:outer membrane receptor protein involved in Fe transport [Altererythrobacter atlanticus]|uniref:Pesticin receptor n=1 Tax=Croceibacterium atlanticum TaxID=1267766 RepID=A0A0F7KXD7_9SPHN|nr:TonB-dependent receptor [Croceibacterium atlanticum]AKH44349.1 Pesticin receptor precursor [Croceibacterium atlanticum]MBB5733934.1 outer membrane receptor protein involved in Fe transport [Croceibacterium atlanticum]